VSAIADIERRKMLQYLSAFKLPNGNAAFGERRLPVIAPLGALRFPPMSHILSPHIEREE
jgi:hypothetical protein